MSIVREQFDLSPTVARIVSVLRGRIESGVYKGGEWLPTERALGDEFGVSRILIRSAIKELERLRLVSRSARRRPLVRGATPSRRAAPAVARPSLALWISPEPSWPGSAMIIRGVQAAMGDEFRLMLQSPIGDTWPAISASEARFLSHIRRDSDIRGVILSYMGGITNLPELEALREAGVPMVFLDHHPPAGFDADFVGVNNVQAAEHVVEHLLALGHRSIAHVSNFDAVSTVAERLAGYRLALERAGLPFRPELVPRDPGPPGRDPREGCEGLIDDLRNAPDPPTAIFAVNDIVALRVVAALRARGVSVPEQMTVAGFDGIERWMPTEPFLTTIYQPFDRIGAEAVNLLRARVEAGPNAPFRHVILDARLVIHNSTAAMREG